MHPQVLAHYEAEVINPFRVLGVPLTKDKITLVMISSQLISFRREVATSRLNSCPHVRQISGFFSGAILGVVTRIIHHREDMRAVLLCHGPL